LVTVPTPTTDRAEQDLPRQTAPLAPPAVLVTIDEAEFDLAFRGYRPDQVHSTLDQIRFEVAEMSTAYGQARREAESLRIRLERPADPPPPPPPAPAPPPSAAPISHRVATLLDEAQQLVTDQFRGAAERAEGIVEAAERLAQELTADAQRQAAAMLDEARRTAADTTARADARDAETATLRQELHSTLHAAFDAVGSLRASFSAEVPEGAPGHDLRDQTAAARADAAPAEDDTARWPPGGRP
jgi:cell division septum initiation protein DivIVA